jgi:RimK family alpha-L-glutamate ligase
MKRAAILTTSENWHVRELTRALAERQFAVVALPVTELTARIGGCPAIACGGVALEECDLVMIRTLPGGTAEQIVYRMDVLQVLERRGVRVVNSPRAIERSVDKYLTSALLAEAGVPTPPTVVAQGFQTAMDSFRAMGDVVAKPLFGSEGRGMVRLTDPDTAYRVFRAWEVIGAVYYLQAFIPHGSRDIRAFVVGDRVVAAMERTGSGWKTNMSQGASGGAVALAPGWAALAVRAARAVGADYAGVDLLPAEDGSVFVPEVNGIPGWAGLQRVADVDIAAMIVDQVLEGLP